MKLRKILSIVIAIMALMLLAGYAVIPRYAVNLIKQYDPYTFERVLEDDTMRVNYGIYDKSIPGDYGYPDFKEISLTSIFDGNQLSSWYVPARKPSGKTIILIHGRWSNRLKTMKYLELLRNTGLDSVYNVMIPDLRNSGRSENAETMMGYEFAEDVVTNMIWLAREQHQQEVLLYGFSMGAMAIAVLLNRVELMKEVKHVNLLIGKIILDSPVANVEKILMRSGQKLGLPKFMLNRTFDLFDEELNGYARKMKLSILLKNTNTPVLILQGTNDVSQPPEILQAELELLASPNVSVELFEGGEHVKLYQFPELTAQYSSVVEKFIRS